MKEAASGIQYQGYIEGSEVGKEDTVCRPDAQQLNEDLIHFLAKQILNSCIQENPSGPKLPNHF